MDNTSDKATQVIDKLKTIPNGFVGQGSKKPTSKSLRKLKKVLQVLQSGRMPFPNITPLPNGGIVLNWISLTRDIVMVVDTDGDIQFTTTLKRLDIDTAEVVERADSEGFITDMLSVDHIMAWFCSDMAHKA